MIFVWSNHDLCFMRRDWVCDQTIILVFKKKYKWKREWSLFDQNMIFVLWEGENEFVKNTTRLYIENEFVKEQTMIFGTSSCDTRLQQYTLKKNKTPDNMHERNSVTQDYNSFTLWHKTTTLLLVSVCSTIRPQDCNSTPCLCLLHDKTTRLQLYSLSLFVPRQDHKTTTLLLMSVCSLCLTWKVSVINKSWNINQRQETQIKL